MKNIIQNTIYGYNPNEYLPVFVDGELANRNAFIAYKAKRAVIGLGSAAGKLLEVTYNGLSTTNPQG